MSFKFLNWLFDDKIAFNYFEGYCYVMIGSYDISLSYSNIDKLLKLLTVDQDLYGIKIDELDINGKVIRYIKDNNLEFNVVDAFGNKINIVVFVPYMYIEFFTKELLADSFKTVKIDNIILKSNYVFSSSYERLFKDKIIEWRIEIDQSYLLSLFISKQINNYKKIYKIIKKVDFDKDKKIFYHNIPISEVVKECEIIKDSFKRSTIYNAIFKLSESLGLQFVSEVCSPVKFNENITLYCLSMDIMDKDGNFVYAIDDDELELSEAKVIAAVTDNSDVKLYDWNSDSEILQRLDLFLYELEKMKLNSAI